VLISLHSAIFFALLLLQLSATVRESLAAQGACESIEICCSFINLANLKTCRMDRSTSIASTGFTLSSERDETVTGIYFTNSQNIFELPEKVFEKFPNLLGFAAQSCQLRFIREGNLKGLSKLRELNLHNNKIESITVDAFQDLVSLEKIFLRKH
jgi:Leucine-rich repeat (LRR) protein